LVEQHPVLLRGENQSGNKITTDKFSVIRTPSPFIYKRLCFVFLIKLYNRIMILDKLKQSTATFHQLSEELNFSNGLLNGSIRREDYLVLLKRLHSLFAQVALLQKKEVAENTIPEFFFEDKARLVYDDIISLENGFTQSSIPFRQMPYYEYLGFCYVAMGSMLGGQFIYRNIVDIEIYKNDPLPFAFYASCKDSVALYWRPFMSYLQAIHEDNHEHVINGATTAYFYFIYLCEVIKNIKPKVQADYFDAIDR
jgi:heme oxygenase